MSVVVTTQQGMIYNDSLPLQSSRTFTVTGWANMSRVPDVGTYYGIVTLSESLSNDNGDIALYWSNDGTNDFLQLAGYDGNNFYTVNFETSPPPNTWFFFALTQVEDEESLALSAYWLLPGQTSITTDQTAAFNSDQLLDEFNWNVIIVGNTSYNEGARSSMFVQTSLWNTNFTTTQILNEKKAFSYLNPLGIVLSWPLLTRTDRRDVSHNNNLPTFLTTTAIPQEAGPPIIQTNLISGPQSQPSPVNSDPVDDNTSLTRPQVSLRWSNDGGNTYGNWINKELGRTGQYNHQVVWYQLGQARNRVFEVQCTDPVEFCIIAATLDATVNDN